MPSFHQIVGLILTFLGLLFFAGVIGMLVLIFYVVVIRRARSGEDMSAVLRSRLLFLHRFTRWVWWIALAIGLVAVFAALLLQSRS